MDRLTIDGLRYYETSRGVFPSVTTVLKETQLPEVKQRLEAWKNREGNKEYLEHCCDRGTALHKSIENYLMGAEDLVIDDEYNAFLQSCKNVVKGISKTYYCEFPVVHEVLGYAGTLDLVAEWQGKLAVFDWKTSSKPKKLSWIKDYILQITAYAKAFERITNTPVDVAIIAIVSPTKTQLFEFNADEINIHFKEWSERVKAFNVLQKTYNPQ